MQVFGSESLEIVVQTCRIRSPILHEHLKEVQLKKNSLVKDDLISGKKHLQRKQISQ